MLSDDDIKQIFFLSDKPRPTALLADDVDIIQFARNIEQFVIKTNIDKRAEIALNLDDYITQAANESRKLIASFVGKNDVSV
jgi:hypothetical protein